MRQVKRVYRLNGNSAEELNRILSQIGDRFDEIDGTQTGSTLDASSLAALAESTAAQLALRRLYESGEMFLNTDHSVVLTTQNTWYQITGYTTGHTYGVTGGTDSLIPSTPGHWRLSAYVSGVSTAASQQIQFGFAVNGTVDTDHLARTSFGTTDPDELSFGGIVAVPSGAALTIWARNLTSSGKTLTVHCSTLIAEIVHKEGQ